MASSEGTQQKLLEYIEKLIDEGHTASDVREAATAYALVARPQTKQGGVTVEMKS